MNLDSKALPKLPAVWIFLFGLLVGCTAHADDGRVAKKVTALREVKEMPYLPELSGDRAYWEVVKEGREAIPVLIDRIDDETPTEAKVPNIGGDYVVGDIVVMALQEIIHGLPIIDCVGGSTENGFNDYWSFVREGHGNRKMLKKRIRRWYSENKNSLKWVVDNEFYRTSNNWPYESKTHPAGGYFVSTSSKLSCLH